ncbi:MAG: hypothetical protein ACREQY_09255 [Candidatus Binatia bacterium]
MKAQVRAIRPTEGLAGVLAFLALVMLLWLAVVPAPAGAAPEEPEFTSQFRLESCKWSSTGAQNAFFPLTPGRRLVLEGEEESSGEVTLIELRFSVLRQTKAISFVSAKGKKIQLTARVIEERELEDGELVEVSRNWFARCVQTGDIYYFGESVDNYEDGEIVNHDGSWRAGVNGALPGIIMPGTYLLGARYFQELAPGVALDRGEHVGMGLTVPTDAGTFRGCVEVLDTNALEPKAKGDRKVYCPGVGLTIDEVIELIEIEHF